jgi:hypothetical protein
MATHNLAKLHRHQLAAHGGLKQPPQRSNRQNPPRHPNAPISARVITRRLLAIAIMKLAGAASIAATTRHFARNTIRPLATLGLIPA